MKKLLYLICTALLLCAMLLNVVSCNQKVSAANLTEGLARGTVTGKTADDAFIEAQMKFAVELFQKSAAESEYENTLISPLSVMVALAMTANGAEGLTEEEMEKVLGNGMSTEDLNAYLYEYVKNLSEEAVLANSIWFRSGEIDVKKDFLQANKDYYDAAVFEAPFDDSTVRDVNRWIEENTNGMIKKMLEKLDDDTVMLLINALTFEGEWATKYEKSDVHDHIFTALDGEEQTVDMMFSDEYQYLEDENAVGFIKNYKGGNYAFAALLPDENIAIDEYVSSLTAARLTEIFDHQMGTSVSVGIPQFSYEYDISMNDILKSMGMESAFDSRANLTDIGISPDGELYVGFVLHKTFIEVDTFGTKATAATIVGVNTECAPMEPEKEVILDRPFVYMIIDLDTNLPVFIGTMTSVK